MARRSQRISTGSVATPKPKHKRAASEGETLSLRTKRPKFKATPTKSEYFQDSAGQDAAANDERDADDIDVSSASNDEASEFDDTNEEASPSSGEEDEDEYDSDVDDTPKRRKKAPPAKSKSTTKFSPTSSTTNAPKTGDLWRPGVKAGLGPGTQLIIKKPQARPAGKIPYRDETIHPNTTLFLAELKANNERQWLKMHDAVFRQSEKDWYTFVEKLTEKLIEVDETIPELPVKDVIFRIYRDVRFSPDPTPYKPHFSAAWIDMLMNGLHKSRTGRKGGYAHYYVQISPHGASFVGGGLWHPDAAPTAAMRRQIDRHPERLKAVLLEDRLRKEFLRGAPKNQRKTVAAFVSANSENALKTKPKGFDADHAEIDLLRLRNYTIGCKLSEEEVVGRTALGRIAELFAAMEPFITYLNSVVMPDDGADDSDDEADEQQQEDGEDEEVEDD